MRSRTAIRIALRTQQIIANESNVIATADPLGGSYFLEKLTVEVEAAANLVTFRTKRGITATYMGSQRYRLATAPWDCSQGGLVLRYHPPEGICLPTGLLVDDISNGTGRATGLREDRLKIV